MNIKGSSKLDKYAKGQVSNVIKHGVTVLGEPNTDFQDNVTKKISSEKIKFGASLLFVILYVLFYVWGDGIKLVFRRNFGRGYLSKTGIIISSFTFLVLAWLSFYFTSYPDYFIRNSGSSDSYFVTGIIIVFLAVYILVVGLWELKKSNSGNIFYYEGEMPVFGFLTKKSANAKSGLSRMDIQTWLEPLTFINAGLAYCFYNLLGGIFFISCGLSLRSAMFLNTLFEKEDLQQKAVQINSRTNQHTNFNEINNE